MNVDKLLESLEATAKANDFVADILVPKQVSDEYLDKELKRDVLTERKKITGKSYKEENFKDYILDVIFQNAIKDKALERRDDTRFGTTPDDYLRIAKELGFEKIYEKAFLSFFEASLNKTKEKFYILWEPRRGILLCFDTYYNQTSVNSGNFYYNFYYKKGCEKSYVTSSGGIRYSDEVDNDRPKYPGYEPMEDEKVRNQYEKDIKAWQEKNRERIVWSGSHDAREALRFNIEQLDKNVVFLPQWNYTPHLWLLHHMDTKGKNGQQLESAQLNQLRKEPKNVETYDSKKITEERISTFPESVKKAIDAPER